MLIAILWILVSIWIFCTDIFFRTISNIQILCIIALCGISYFFSALELNVWIALLTLCIGVFIWRFGVLGAGDVKLLCVLTIIIPYEIIASFFFLTSIIGAVIGVLIYIFARFINIEKSVPYGVAIMSSFLFLFLPYIK